MKAESVESRDNGATVGAMARPRAFRCDGPFFDGAPPSLSGRAGAAFGFRKRDRPLPEAGDVRAGYMAEV